YHRMHDEKDKYKLIHFHLEWRDKKKAEEQIRKNKESERLHKLTFKY
ncbi:unnamed protein product, partial [marine sediment metagenome]